MNLHPVTVHLSAPSAFGTRIRFMPKTWRFWSSHPIVAELTELVKVNASRAQKA